MIQCIYWWFVFWYPKSRVRKLGFDHVCSIATPQSGEFEALKYTLGIFRMTINCSSETFAKIYPLDLLTSSILKEQKRSLLCQKLHDVLMFFSKTCFLQKTFNFHHKKQHDHTIPTDDPTAAHPKWSRTCILLAQPPCTHPNHPKPHLNLKTNPP